MCKGGVLFLLPALIAQGLLKSSKIYQQNEKDYYSLESVMLTIAFMLLSRIKNIEQLKQCNPGEIGRLIGLDRIPETKCLRGKIKQLSSQQKAQAFNQLLSNYWSRQNQADFSFFYIDGHQRIYYGSKANLPKKFISRQKLCLSATTEFWVNDNAGMPVLVVTGQASEKINEAIEAYIIPQMLASGLLNEPVAENPSDEVNCTFVFDREAYHPAFFIKLWKQYRIAVITYRKNAKDKWAKEDFEPYTFKQFGKEVTVQYCEHKTELGGHDFREIRKLNTNGHQVSIITTHPTLPVHQIASQMFQRWQQENYFKYMMANYDFDKMVSYGVEEVDQQKQVVNPIYRNLTKDLKKVRDKMTRLQANFFKLVKQATEKSIDEMPKLSQRQENYFEQINQHEATEELLLEARAEQPSKITIAQMPKEKRYNRLKLESKLLMNTIMMICYRAETAVAEILADHMKKRGTEEKRMLVKQIINNTVDLSPDYKNQTLTVTLHSLSAPRYNRAAKKLTAILNETDTIFPNSNLKMRFETTF